ncbi:MAG: LysR family transcriptional regulator [Gammaproteobacteria bacterium]|nr:LysR family transcriptional regulator [Gammaproteobacteria bacterium]
MEIYQLKTFVKVAEEKHLTRAAAQLFTSQPAISAHIKALEEELGVTLFHRTPKGMTLTPEGELLHRQAITILEAAEALKSQAMSLQNELLGEIRIGVHTDFDFMRIGRLHQQMSERHPRIQLHIDQGMSATIIPEVRKGNQDGGFFFGPCRLTDLSVTRLMDVPMAAVGPASWKDRIKDAGVEELAALPWIYTSSTCPFHRLGEALFEELDSEPQRVAYVDSEEAVRELIRAEAGIALLRYDDAVQLEQSGIGYRWPGEVPGIELQFAVQKRREREPLIEALSTCVKELWEVSDANVAVGVAE